MNMFNPFTWFGRKKEEPESKTSPRRPSIMDMTGGQPANEELLLGLYHGTYPGLEKASPLARVPINTPVNLMGIPTPICKGDERTQEKLNDIRRAMAQEIKLINKMTFLTGTSWVYPKWDNRSGNGLIWKVLRDSIVADVLISLATDLPVGVITDEQINLSVGENRVTTVRRKTIYTADRVVVTHTGAAAGLVDDRTARNVARTPPIMFANEADDLYSRGHSLLEPCLCDFKDYHDIDYRVSEVLARFRVKQIQKLRDGTGMKDWRHNNGLDDDSDFENFDVADQDLLFVVGKDEDTDYKFLPEGATAAAEKALERLAWKIICATETPEIFFGKAVSGNVGSYAEQMHMMVTKVQGLRENLNWAYKELFKASLILCGVAESTNYSLDFDMDWNRLSALSEKDKAEILSKFCSSVSVGVANGAIGINQLYQLWQQHFPEIAVGTLDEFKAELVKTGNLQQFIKQDYATGELIMTAAGGAKEVIDRVVKLEGE